MLTHLRLTQSVFVAMLWVVLAAGVGDLRCFAQSSVAQLSGVIRDPSGSAIVGAQIKITQIETKQERQLTSDDQGRYVAPALPVGPYQLEVTAAGFKAYLQSGIVLEVGNNVDVNVPMQIGSTSERIDVSAQANMVETRENTISQVIDERRIVELPLNGRQATQLILLSGAAANAPIGSGDLNGTKSIAGTVTISVAGGQANGVNYLLDGADNNDAFSNVNLPMPFPDALQEFSVQTSSLPVRYGLHPAAVVNAVTKSGTNDWHGSLFEFLRNGNMNARNFFAPVHDSLKRNQFGGTFGGRIIRDKLFFFGGFQGTINRSSPPQQIAFVPTPAVLNGDFSTILGPGCVSGGKGKSIIDPVSGLPFSNNQIPVGRFDAAALAITKLLPTAQADPCGRVTYGFVSTGDDNQVVGRVDWLQSSKHSLYGRYFILDYRNPAVYSGNLLTTSAPGNLERTNAGTFGDTYTFSPTVLNSAHATFTRRRNDRDNAAGIPNSAALGITIPTGPSPFVPVSGYFSFGCSNCKTAFFNVNSWSFTDDVDVIRGKHQMAFGMNLLRNQMNSRNDQQGVYNFNGQYATGKSTGDALAAFMLGAMNDFNQVGLTEIVGRQTIFALYAQDSIRLTPRLTVNVGLRWDPALIVYDKFNRGLTFSQAGFNAGQRSTVFPNAPAGISFYGDPGVPRAMQNGDWKLFSPRIGFVWDPTGSGRQTIRISSAILRDTVELWENNDISSKNLPYSGTVDRPTPFASGGTFSNPWGGFPGGSPFPLPNPPLKNAAFPNGTFYYVIPPQYRAPYMLQWSVSYQRQITPNWLASVTYLGNKTTHVVSATDINPGTYIPGSTAGLNARRPLFLQNPTLGAAFGSIYAADPNGNANYNGLLLSIQHRFSQGFTLLTNYTWSHCLSDEDHYRSLNGPEESQPANRRADYGNCNFDIRHQMNTSIVAVSPVKGNGLAGRLLGQWQVSPVIVMRAGTPFNVTSGTDISQTGLGFDRPNVVAGNDPYLFTSDRTQYLNRAAFQNAAAGQFGNLGRNVLIGPGAVNFDVALSRTFRIRERWQLTPRAEAFNIINHANLAAPVGVLTSNQFGKITGGSIAGGNGNITFANAGDPRILQFALKLQF